MIGLIALRKAAIVRMLGNTTVLVIGNEPTTNLNFLTPDGITHLMLDIQSWFDTGFVICTYNKNLLSETGQLIHIEDGKKDTGELQ